ncbi:reverse transcriptase domain-containing protein [Tanacetum coccineum]
MPPKRTSTSETPAITLAAIQQLINDGISSALKAQAASMASDSNPYRNPEPTRFLCSKMESIMSSLSCNFLLQCHYAEENKVTYATGTLTDDALSWWNSYAQPIRINQANQITWIELKRLLTDKYCPRTEVKKMEADIYNLVVKGNDIKTYIRRFPRISRLMPKHGVWEVGVGVLCELKVCGAAVGRSGAVVCGGGGRVVGVCCDCGLGVGMIWFGLVVVWGGKGAVWGGVWGSVSYCRLGVVIGSVRRMLRVVVCWVVGGGVGVHCGRGGGGGPGLLGRLQGGAGGVGVLCDKVACQCLRWGGSSLFCVPAAAGVGRGCLWGDEGWWWGVVVGWVVVAVGSWCGWSVGGGEADMCCGCGAYMGRTNLWGVGMWFSMGGGGYSVFRPLIAVV